MPEYMYEDYLEKKLDSVFEIEKPRKLELVQKDSKYNYKDENGNLLREKWFDKLWPFHDGVARFIEKNKYGYIKENGEIISVVDGNFQTNYLLDYATDFQDGIAAVVYRGELNSENGNCYYLIDTDGREISGGYYSVNDIKDGYVSVTRNIRDGEYYKKYTLAVNYLKSKNNHGIVSWFNDFSNIKQIANGFVIITKKDSHNNTHAIFSNKGFRITPWSKKKSKPYVFSKQFFVVDEKVVCADIDFDDYEVHRYDYNKKKNLVTKKIDFEKYSIESYESSLFLCIKGKDVFYTNHKPIKIYGNGIALCFGDVYVFLHNEGNEDNKEQLIGPFSSTRYDDHFIFDDWHNRVFFIYNGKVYDVSKYYEKHLKNKKYNIKNFDVGIFTRDEFVHLEKRERKPDKKLEKTLVEIENPSDSLSKLEAELEKETGKIAPTKRFKVSNLFIPEDDYLIINPTYIRLNKLNSIDFTGVRFTDVKVSGIDFRGCNITFGENGLNPQEVWEKDLTGCNFEGIHIKQGIDFTGVDIRGTRFGIDHNLDTDERGSDTFQDAIYDETTTYNGIPFTMIYGECQNKKEGASK